MNVSGTLPPKIHSNIDITKGSRSIPVRNYNSNASWGLGFS